MLHLACAVASKISFQLICIKLDWGIIQKINFEVTTANLNLAPLRYIYGYT